MPMAANVNISGNPLNSDYGEKLLLDGLISTPNNNEHMYILFHNILMYVHEKTRYNDTCKKASGGNREKNKKGFKQK
jgi:hypothetical protein